MRTETPVAVRLADYTAYPFDIEHVDLAFELDSDATKVTATLRISRKNKGGDASLVLDGEALKLVSIELDGRTLTPSDYTVTENALTLPDVPDTFELKTLVEIAPARNTALSGLYMSGGRFCSQCESVGFRRITYYPDRPDVMSRFFVTITADKAACPIMLSNGTPGPVTEAGKGRHTATWDDPHKKPSYLFALCAGDYDIYRDTFTTMSGKQIDLAIHVDKGDAPRAAWAMDSLKRSMTWDEEAYGREYDLGVFNIVAVRDFNFGAMENKGLNVFNSAYVLADEDSATDADFEAIESIVAHEYFHNWTGNRITCRDWFQLCLKEGLTVFRDQNFSADMRSRSVQRIKDVIRLRARQFAEDAGPLAHAVRPANYGAIDNLYTATVYEKGAELIGMLRRIIGPEAYRKGMDLYFDRHDGQAVTIEDFYACFADVTGKDFGPFLRWYAQAGTPKVTVEESWNEAASELTVSLSQKTLPTPGQPDKQPVPIPLELALLDGKGGTDAWMVVLDTPEATVTRKAPGGRPLLSVNRDFSAPVRIERDLTRDQRLALVTAETDPYNQWEGVQTLVTEEILKLSEGSQAKPDSDLVSAIATAIRNASGDPAFAALLTRLPEVGELFLERRPADPVALHSARRRLQAALSGALAPTITDTLAAPSPTPYRPSAEQAGIRALRGAFINLLGASEATDAPQKLLSLFENAPNMTERLAAMRALTMKGKCPERDKALADFEQSWKHNPIVMDKWFAVQAGQGTAATVAELAAHPDFDLKNPNRVRAVVGVFSTANLAAFHAPDGSGYRAVEDIILEADAANPALAARLLAAFEQWRVLEPKAGAAAQVTLKRLQDANLSPNSADIVGRALG